MAKFPVPSGGREDTAVVVQTDHAEVYRQRYETWRYLDRMKWQMVQILVAIYAGSGVYLNAVESRWLGCFLLLAGLAVVLISWAIYRISTGLRANSRVLREAAEALGDAGIPEVRSRWRSVSHYIMLFGVVSGTVSMGWGIMLFFQQSEV